MREGYYEHLRAAPEGGAAYEDWARRQAVHGPQHARPSSALSHRGAAPPPDREDAPGGVGGAPPSGLLARIPAEWRDGGGALSRAVQSRPKSAAPRMEGRAPVRRVRDADGFLGEASPLPPAAAAQAAARQRLLERSAARRVAEARRAEAWAEWKRLPRKSRGSMPVEW